MGLTVENDQLMLISAIFSSFQEVAHCEDADRIISLRSKLKTTFQTVINSITLRKKERFKENFRPVIILRAPKCPYKLFTFFFGDVLDPLGHCGLS